MNHRWSVVSLGFACLAAAWAIVSAGTAQAAPQTIAMRKCVVYACDSAESLKNEGRAASQALPLGTIVLVSSQRYPLSAFVQVCTGPRGFKSACLLTAGDLGAIELDNRVHARAAKIAPIDIPPEVAPTATQAIQEIAESWAFSEGILFVTGRIGIDPWHNLFNPLTWPWLEILDLRTGELNRVHVKDRITLRFPDGSTVQLEMQGLSGASGHFFKFMFDTIRLPNGDPFVAAVSPVPAAPIGAGMSLASPWPSGTYADALVFAFCFFLNSHCDFEAGGRVYECYYRREYFPCG